MNSLGDVVAAAVLNFKFNTDVNGTPFTLTGGVVSIWKQGSTTPITAGITLTTDYESITGLHNVAIDLADAAYASAKDYQAYLSAGSVNGISRIGEVLAEFSIEHRSVAAVKAKTDNLPSDPADESLIIAATDAVMARLGSPAGASVSADVAAVKTDTASIISTLSGLAAAAATAVWGAATRLLTAGTNIVLAKGTGVTGFNDLSAAQVNAEADTALADVGVTTTVTGRIDAAISTRLASASYTAPPSVGAIADQVWEETLGDHSGTAGSTAAALAASGGAGDPWITPLPGAYAAGTAGKILGDKLDATVSSRSSQTSVDDLPTNAELAIALAAADDPVLAAIAALWTTALTESYAADGAAPTPAQALFLIQQRLTEFAISATTVTIKKLNGSTTAATLTLDDATSPTSSTRAT